MTRPLLRIRDLTVAFPDPRRGAREVVHGIDLDVARGQVLALVGESGSGKSVTAQSVLRLHPAGVQVGGRVLLDETDLLGPGRRRRCASVRGSRVGMVFQEPMAAWNPVHTRRPADRGGARGARAPPRCGPGGGPGRRVRELLDSVGLDDPASDRSRRTPTSSPAASSSGR